MTIDLLILTGFLILSSFVYGGILFAVMIGILFFYMVDPYGRRSDMLFPGAGYFAAIMLIGLAGIAGKPSYDVLKDIWYVVNAALPILIGYVVMQRAKDILPVLRSFVIAAAVVAGLHVLQFALNPAYLAESYVDIRAQVSPGYFLLVPGIALLFGDRKFKLGLLKSRWAGWSIMLLSFLSVGLSFSRTLWLAVLTTAGIVLAGSVKRALRLAVALTGMAVILSLTAGQSATEDLSESGTFVEKTVNSFQELEGSGDMTMTDINKFWRGFESYQALQAYSAGSPFEYLRGQGFGTLVDLGLVMTLNDADFERIPVLHNGYLYLLVKTGIAGLAAYLLFLLFTFRSGMRLTALADREARFSGLMLVSLTLVVLETTLVISGLFSKAALYQIALLIGVLLRNAEVVSSENGVVGSVGELPPGSDRRENLHGTGERTCS